MGCLVLEMVTGSQPWLSDLMLQILGDENADPPALPAKLSSKARNFLCYSLQRDAADRKG